MDYADALAYLDDHINLERLVGPPRVEAPTLARMQRLMSVMGEPQRAYPVIHLTGTNGKGSTAQIVTRLLVAHGLTVGTYTSPHLDRVNERIARNGEPIADPDFAEAIGEVARFESLADVRPSYFEALTAAAYSWFADVAVDVAVVEVGLLGTWDATNVADGEVAVITNVGLDHTEYAGPTRAHIAAEKAGIVKPGARLVLGETDPALTPLFRARQPSVVWERDLDYDADPNELAFGGRLLTIRTPYGTHPEVFLPLHGQHQGDNAATAVAAVELFFDAPVDDAVLVEGFAEVAMPGRFEVLGRQPLVVVDGAHNLMGADQLATTFHDDFAPAGQLVLVAGFLRGRKPADMLAALRADEAALVVATTPPSPRAVPAEETARAARALGCDDVVVVPDVARACEVALGRVVADDAVLVTGSLYVVGAARSHLVHRLPG